MISFRVDENFLSLPNFWCDPKGAPKDPVRPRRPRPRNNLPRELIIAQMIDIDAWNKNLKVFLMCPKNFFRYRQKAIFTTRISEKPAKSNIFKSTQPIATNKVSNESI